MKVTNKRHKHFDIADKYKNKKDNVSGYKLTRAARKAEREKKGKGSKMLAKYVPALSEKQRTAILKGKRCLVGVNVFFYAMDSNWVKKHPKKLKQALKER